MEDDDVIKEFLIESHEGLDQMDREFIALEADPSDHDRITTIFRTIHTVKGTSGFFGFKRLEALTHVGENLLVMLRDKKLTLTAEITSALLSLVDHVRIILGHIEAGNGEGTESHDELQQLLTNLVEGKSAAAPAKAKAKAAPKSDAVADAPAEDKSAVKPITKAPVKRNFAKLAAEASAAAAEAAFGAGKSKPETGKSTPEVGFEAEPEALAALDLGEVTVDLALEPTQEAVHESAPAAASPAAAAAAGEAVASSLSESNIRVDISVLDTLMNLVGELVLARNQMIQLGAIIEDSAFASATQRLDLITTELQSHVMKTRMQPIGNVWSKLPRVVRDLAVACGKQIRVEMFGKETELDRTVLEAIKDPLTHIVRNAADHGLEDPETRVALGKPKTGNLVLRAFHEGGQVNIEVSDDGKGLNLEAMKRKALERNLITPERAAALSEYELTQLAFLPGLSTAEKVSNVSGRGVGMDVVKTNIERIGGTIDLISKAGRGTTIKIRIPLTLAIVPSLVVICAGQRYTIPQTNLIELVRLDGSNALTAIEEIHGAPVYRLRGRLLPLIRLDRTLGLPESDTIATDGSNMAVNIIVLQVNGQHLGLIVDEVLNTEEIVVKPLGKELKNVSVFAGATIMGDGRIALILDVVGMAQHAGAISRIQDLDQKNVVSDEAALHGLIGEEKESLLLFGPDYTSLLAIPLSMVYRLEEFPCSRIEKSGGRSVVQYRDEILSLIDLRTAASDNPDATISVIVYAENDRSVGFIVEHIDDVVDEVVKLQPSTAEYGTLGSAVISGRVTGIFNLDEIIRTQAPWFREGRAA